MPATSAPIILIVDDSEDDFLLVKRQIGKHWPKAKLKHAQSAEALSRLLDDVPPDLVVCDYAMPDIRPTAVRALLDLKGLVVPTVLMSGCSSEAMGARAMLEGFSDYVEKHQPDRLIPVIERELQNSWMRQERDYLQVAHQLALQIDAETGFLSKLGLSLEIEQALDKGIPLTLIKVNLSKLTDEGLAKYLMRLSSLLPKKQIARVNHQTFVLLLEGLEIGETTTEDGLSMLATLDSNLRAPLILGEMLLSPSVTIGLSRVGIDGNQLSDLLNHARAVADELCHLGQTLVHARTQAIHQAARRHLMLAEQLATAIRERAMCLAFQPVLHVPTGGVIGVEALVRWEHPMLGRVMPDEFIQIAEDNGLIELLGSLVLEQACAFLQQSQTLGHEVWCAINCSASQLIGVEFAGLISEQLVKHGIAANQLELEITETAAIANLEQAQIAIRRLTALGCSIAMDDFGTGYSSLSYLQKLPVQVLKIDKSFIENLTLDGPTKKIVRAVVDLGHALGLEVHAEGIENDAQLQALKEMGCDRIQGYLIAQPMDQATLLEWLDTRRLHTDG